MFFSDYLKQFSDENSVRGDLSRDFIKSKSRAKTYAGVLKNLQKNNACDVAIDTLNEIYKMYNKEKGI